MDGIQENIFDELRRIAETVADGKYGPGLHFDYEALQDDLADAVDNLELDN